MKRSLAGQLSIVGLLVGKEELRGFGEGCCRRSLEADLLCVSRHLQFLPEFILLQPQGIITLNADHNYLALAEGSISKTLFYIQYKVRPTYSCHVIRDLILPPVLEAECSLVPHF